MLPKWQSTTGNSVFFQSYHINTALRFSFYTYCLFYSGNIWAYWKCVAGGIVSASGSLNARCAHGSLDTQISKLYCCFFPEYYRGSSLCESKKHNVIHHAYTTVDGGMMDVDYQPWIA